MEKAYEPLLRLLLFGL